MTQSSCGRPNPLLGEYMVVPPFVHRNTGVDCPCAMSQATGADRAPTSQARVSAPLWLTRASTTIEDLPLVEVWAARIDASDLPSLLLHLTPEEIEQVRRLRPHVDRQRSAMGRVMTRMILASRSGVLPDEVEFDREPSGRPVLAGPPHPSLHFNTSHSGSFVVIAIADSPVGVDIEQVRPTRGRDALLREALNTHEREHVRAAADPDVEFFRMWTAKESYVKATGEGLRALPDVSLTRLSSPRWSVVRDHAPADGWSLGPLRLPPATWGAHASRCAADASEDRATSADPTSGSRVDKAHEHRTAWEPKVHGGPEHRRRPKAPDLLTQLHIPLERVRRPRQSSRLTRSGPRSRGGRLRSFAASAASRTGLTSSRSRAPYHLLTEATIPVTTHRHKRCSHVPTNPLRQLAHSR
ncbi:4'-phosphopantetheinyl transferase family protein [Clavibacter michiganensis]|uniref:4'-phosphopantetheinyl transferase family protein n=1 Tax=Clavibacter michiganensis TaxID=28447 RepID=UPI0009BAC0D6